MKILLTGPRRALRPALTFLIALTLGACFYSSRINKQPIVLKEGSFACMTMLLPDYGDTLNYDQPPALVAANGGIVFARIIYQDVVGGDIGANDFTEVKIYRKPCDPPESTSVTREVSSVRTNPYGPPAKTRRCEIRIRNQAFKYILYYTTESPHNAELQRRTAIDDSLFEVMANSIAIQEIR